MHTAKPKKLYTVLIAEDEPRALEYLADLVQSDGRFALEATVSDANSLSAALSASRFDIAFLDIELGDGMSIEVLEKLERLPGVVLTTAHRHFAPEAFELGVIDYLIKPFTADRFRTAAERVVERIAANGVASEAPSAGQSFGLLVYEDARFTMIPFHQILYLQAWRQKTRIRVPHRFHETTRYIKDLEPRLPSAMFRRVHRQYVLNIEKIASLEYIAGGTYQAVLNDRDATPIPVGRAYSKALFEFLEGPRKAPSE